MSKRPFGVTLSLWLVLFLTVWNGFRLWTAIAWRDVLNEFAVRPGPIITAISGAFWLVTGSILLWGILLKKAWAGKMLIGAAAGYSVWYWSERLVWQEPRQNWPFAVILNLILLVFIFLTTKSLTREAYDRKVENPRVE
ncbi:MAG: hypothetical protein HZB19_04690 [Chloroflexi bacterium]|nr:hypothetical protein [Chloroflexota bacterium]